FLSARLRRLVAAPVSPRPYVLGVFCAAVPEPPDAYPTGVDGQLGISHVGSGAAARASPALTTVQLVPAPPPRRGAPRRERAPPPSAGGARREKSQCSQILVPTPASVNTSSSSTCGTRPSRMCAAPLPPATASRQVSTLGIMPPEMVPSRIR